MNRHIFMFSNPFFVVHFDGRNWPLAVGLKNPADATIAKSRRVSGIDHIHSSGCSGGIVATLAWSNGL